MDQRIAMDTLERRPDIQRVLVSGTEHSGRLGDQKRAKALAAAKARVPHRFKKPRWPGDFTGGRLRRQQSIQQVLYFLCCLSERLLQGSIVPKVAGAGFAYRFSGLGNQGGVLWNKLRSGTNSALRMMFPKSNKSAD